MTDTALLESDSPSRDASSDERDAARLEALRRARFAAECLLFVGADEAAARELEQLRRLARASLDEPGIASDAAPWRGTLVGGEASPESLVAASFALEGRLAERVEGSRRRRRLGLVASAVLLALATVGGLAATGRPPVVHASGVWADDRAYAASNAVDGDSRTEWLLPDGAAGTLDIVLRPARDVHDVLLLNGHNGPFSDRAADAVRVELYRGPSRVAGVDARLGPYDAWPLYVPVAARASRVDRVRVVVRTHHRRGSALAEVVIR